MLTKTRPVRLWHLIIVALLLAVFVTLWSAEVYIETYPGYEERGFPIPWKTIYGGVDVRNDYTNLFMNITIWFAIVFLVIIALFIYGLKWKPA